MLASKGLIGVVNGDGVVLEEWMDGDLFNVWLESTLGISFVG